MLLSVVFTFIAFSYVAGDDLKSRILFGEQANIADFPYYAALEDCSATIISESWLITAAHCVALDDHKFGPVWVGGNNTQSSEEHKYDTVVIHPDFRITDQILSNDIALLRLSEPLEFDETIQPVHLPERSDSDYRYNYEGYIHTVVGTGKREGNLMKINVTPLSLEECLSHFSLAERILMYPRRYLLDEYLCAKRDGYNHDMPGLSHAASGSPLVYNDILRGLAVSFGDPLQTTISTFIKITDHTEWIRFITGIRAASPRPSEPEPERSDGD